MRNYNELTELKDYSVLMLRTGEKIYFNEEGVQFGTSPTRKNHDSPKNFTEILKIGSRNYLELALLISLSINFLTFLIFVCIYFK